MDADPATRNVFGVMEASPAIARDGVRLRQFGQQVIERLAGKRIHPAWVVPGGVNEPLSAATAMRSLRGCPRRSPSRSARWTGSRRIWSASAKKSACSPISPPMFLGLVGADRSPRPLRRKLRFLDAGGHIVADGIDPSQYASHIAEIAHPWTLS